MKLFLNLIVVIFLAGLLWECSNSAEDQAVIIRFDSDWELFSSSHNPELGDIISKETFVPKHMLYTEVPSTVFNAQVKNDVYKEIYKGMNLAQISDAIYKESWWYRKVFDIIPNSNYFELNLEGINYKANIWLNGKIIADTKEVNNAFKMYRYDITEIITKGKNTLAIEVFPPKKGDFSIGFVDWNPAPPDNNMGLFRSVSIASINTVQIIEPYIDYEFIEKDYSLVKQNLRVKLKNYSKKEIKGELKIYISKAIINKEISIDALSTKEILLTSDEYDELILKNPELWWPHTMGDPYLHHMEISFMSNDKELCSKGLEYGIRELGEYYTEEGHRGFSINGKKISIRGAGWVDNMMLDNTHAYDDAQLEYVKDMNLNTIRLEGFWGKDSHIYDKCDELGILVMVGWSCHWEWEDYLGKYCDEKYGGILNDEDIDLMSAAWRDQLVWLRNHPAIMAWFSGSDCVPIPKLEQKYFDIFEQYDTSRIYLASAKEWESADINTGVKMRGPYAYVPPVYWFADTLYGGAFGFNTETGPGAQVPPLESIKKMIPKEDLWPINDVWDYHCGRNEFNNLDRYTKALNERYGEAQSVEEYAQKAQLLNYELMRPMFEAFSVNRYQATGVIQWMLNSAWPEMYWQLYDSYLLPNAAYFATKKAGEPLHALYNYHNKNIYLVNDQLVDQEDVAVQIRVYDVYSHEIFNKIVKVTITENSSQMILELPSFENYSEVYFVHLAVIQDGMDISSNFYWLSQKNDVLDYEAELPSWYYHTPSKAFADFSSLNRLKEALISWEIETIETETTTIFKALVENKTDVVAFFIEGRLVDKNTQLSILPAIWTDNYFSLLPREKRYISVKVKTKDVAKKNPVLHFKAVNDKK